MWVWNLISPNETGTYVECFGEEGSEEGRIFGPKKRDGEQETGENFHCGGFLICILHHVYSGHQIKNNYVG